MKKIFFAFQAMTIVMTLLFLGSCGKQETETKQAPAPVSHKYSMEQFMKTTSISGTSFNHDDTKLLVSSNESGIFNVYELDLATSKRTAITESDETTFGVSYMPSDDRILYTQDKGGNENNHLFLRNTDSSVVDLTKGADTKEVFMGFNNDLLTFFTLNNERDTRYFDLFQWDTITLEKVMIYRNEGDMDPSAISPNARWLVLDKINTNNDSHIYVLDLANGGEPKLISSHQGEARFSTQAIDVGSKYLYYTSNADGEFARLRRYEFATGHHQDFYSSDWDVVFTYFSRLGTFQVIGTNEDGYTKVQVTRDGTVIEIKGLPAGTVTGISFANSEKLMKLTVSSDTMPGNIFVYNLDTGEVKQVTDTLNPEIDGNDLVASTVARFKARDGMIIPGPLYKPMGASAEHKVPAVLWIHGGPGDQSRAGYRAEKQFLINNGYALFAVNNRGSSGYGKSFFAADDGRHGREPLWDCIDAKEYLKTLDWVDKDRIGILGGSYGGYMTLAALAFHPDEFVCGVDVFGVSNWITTLENIPPYWESYRLALYNEIGDPEKDREFLHQTSPVFHGDKITKPLLVLQGANDPRVLKAESDNMVAAIKENGGTVEYMVFDDEGHGFRKSNNRIAGFNKMLEFLDMYLKGKETP